MNTIEDWKALKPSSWVTVNHVLRPDMRLLRDSLTTYGWLLPIVVRSEDKAIIDGYHRWMIAAENPDTLGQEVPVVWVDCDEIDAMVLHVTLNRARGIILNKDLSTLLKRIRRSKKFDDDYLMRALGMTMDEFDLLADGTLIKMRNVKAHRYNKAWVPVETSSAPSPIPIERPPGKDA